MARAALSLPVFTDAAVCCSLREASSTCEEEAVNDHRFSRRYFFYGTLLAGAVPKGGFGSTPSLSGSGYKSPNEKAQRCGGRIWIRGPAILVGAAATENIVALCDVDEARWAQGFRS
jgi:hypothetical protein